MYPGIGCIRKPIRGTAENRWKSVGRNRAGATYAGAMMNDIERIAAPASTAPARIVLPGEDVLSDLCLDLMAPRAPLMRPVRRAILAVDIENSTTRTNPAKAWLRQAMYDLIEAALGVARIGREHHDPLVDRGDGVLALIRQTDDVPTTTLLDTVVPALSRALRSHNERRPDRAMRLRAVLHAGEVLHDGHGCFSQALDLAFRLLDAPATRVALRRAWPAPMALVVSEDIHSSVVAQGYPGIAEHGYEPGVRVMIAEKTHIGWTHVPGC